MIVGATLLGAGVCSLVPSPVSAAPSRASVGSVNAMAAALASRYPHLLLPAGARRVPHGVIGRAAVAPRRLAPTPQLTGSSTISRIFVVDTDEDSGLAVVGGTSCVDARSHKCSLRAAVDAADNSLRETDEIELAPGIDPVLSKSGPLMLTGSMVIDAPGHTVSGGGVTEVFAEEGDASVEISGLDIEDGVLTDGVSPSGGVTGSPPGGGGIYCGGGSLVLSHVSVAHDTSIWQNPQEDEVGAFGGGIYVGPACQFWLESSIVEDDVAMSVTTDDGAAAAPRSTTAPCGATAAGGFGGGLYIDGSGYIAHSTIGGPRATACNVAQFGAGLYNDGTTVVVDSTVSYNDSGRSSGVSSPEPAEGVGVYNDNVIDISGSALDHNSSDEDGTGTGLANEWVAQLSGSSVSFNSDNDSQYPSTDDSATAAGPAVFDDGDLMTMVGDALDGNANTSTDGASIDGGAIYGDTGSFTIEDCTISGTVNSTAGGAIEGGAIYVANPQETIEGLDIAGTSNSAGGGGSIAGGDIAVGFLTGAGTATESTLSSVRVTGTSNAAGEIFGGAVVAADPLTVDGMTIDGTSDCACAASGQIDGGAVESVGDTELGGIGSLTLDHVAIDGTRLRALGQAEVAGGVIAAAYTALASNALSVDGFTLAGRRGETTILGGGIIDLEGSVTLDDAEILGAQIGTAAGEVAGGLMFTEDSPLAATDLTLGNSTVIASGSVFGSLLADAGGATTIVNGTFAGVRSSVPATAGNVDYGIYASCASGPGACGASGATNRPARSSQPASFLELSNATIGEDGVAGPKGSAALVESDATLVSLRNSILSGDPPVSPLGTSANGAGVAPNCATADGGEIVSLGPDLDSGRSCRFDTRGDIQGENADLLPLADKGGLVETAALAPDTYGPFHQGSPAIGAGSPAGCPLYDARGVARPDPGGCDLGAYQVPAQGYWISSRDGALIRFGGADAHGSVFADQQRHLIGQLGGPIVAISATAGQDGYLQVGSDGGVFAFGDARYEGSLGGLRLAAPVAAAANDPTGTGYWLADAAGRVTAFGAAGNYGSEDYEVAHEAVSAIVATLDGRGYWLATADGHVLGFGDAAVQFPHQGSPVASGIKLARPIVAMVATPDGKGYWLVASDGGVFAYGDARYYGGCGGKSIPAPIVAAVTTPDGLGYWLFAADGTVYNFGDAEPLGSLSTRSGSDLVSGAAASNSPPVFAAYR